jgi:tetratricopeptide (TPR) repeat protein
MTQTQTHTPDELSSQGKVLFGEKKYLEAADLFRAAIAGYNAAGDELNSAENANNLCVVLVRCGEADQALNVVKNTPFIFEKAGDTRRQAMAFGNLGLVLRKLNQTEEAISAYEQASELFKSIGEHEMRAPVLAALSDLQLLTGRGYEAIATANAGLGEAGETNFIKRVLKKILNIPMRMFFHLK